MAGRQGDETRAAMSGVMEEGIPGKHLLMLYCTADKPFAQLKSSYS